jgi:hypothetical protein
LLVDNAMSTQPLRHSSPTGSATKAEAEAREPTAHPPSAKTVAARLARLTADAMPWLSKDVDLTPPDGGPEAVGPASYPTPAKQG